ncbi:DUF1353 domain-containing protein [Photobacterium chitinilyticum]|uniref:DUF1353 domain-containing protein n=1 Tax=Photobacterium chitinilyticum TaxID=2485123 RepID=UPI003D0EEE94
MEDRFITYRSGYKYQLASNSSVNTGLHIDTAIDDGHFLKLDLDGNLHIKKGYAWDGPSGPVVDTKENMRASLVHDALYQLMRNEHLDRNVYKKAADKLFEKICIEDGVPEELARVYYLGLKIGGHPSTDPKNKKVVHIAPEPRA